MNNKALWVTVAASLMVGLGGCASWPGATSNQERMVWQQIKNRQHRDEQAILEVSRKIDAVQSFVVGPASHPPHEAEITALRVQVRELATAVDRVTRQTERLRFQVVALRAEIRATNTEVKRMDAQRRELLKKLYTQHILKSGTEESNNGR